jgi:hypothetical protein
MPDQSNSSTSSNILVNGRDFNIVMNGDTGNFATEGAEVQVTNLQSYWLAKQFDRFCN